MGEQEKKKGLYCIFCGSYLDNFKHVEGKIRCKNKKCNSEMSIEYDGVNIFLEGERSKKNETEVQIYCPFCKGKIFHYKTVIGPGNCPKCGSEFSYKYDGKRMILTGRRHKK